MYKTIGSDKFWIGEFNSLTLAKSNADRSVKAKMIVLGDGGKYWVVSPREGEKLVKLGYEYAA